MTYDLNMQTKKNVSLQQHNTELLKNLAVLEKEESKKNVVLQQNNSKLLKRISVLEKVI